MSLPGLLNQTITIYAKTSYNEQGREVVAGAVSARARIQETTKRVLMPDGELLTIDLVAYVGPSTAVNTDDRVDYGTNKFKVWGKYSAVNGAGAVNHIKLELIKWRET